MGNRKTLGIIGAGNIGGTLAKLAAGAGYEVILSNSRGPASLAELVSGLGENVRAATVKEAAAGADIVFEAIPYGALDSLPKDALRGKTLISASNYYPDRDGDIEVQGSQTARVAAMLPDTRVVKAFNTIWYQHLAERGDTGKPADERRVVTVAGDDEAAVDSVIALVHDLGFGALRFDSLAASAGLLEPGGALYNQDLTLAQARERLAQ